jgi:hypothetical protein
MAVAHDALLARRGLEIGVLCEKLSNLRFDGLDQQRTRAARRISVRESVKAPGWASLMTLLSDTAYHSFIGEVEALNTTTIRRLTRSRRHQLLAIARFAAVRMTSATILQSARPHRTEG